MINFCMCGRYPLHKPLHKLGFTNLVPFAKKKDSIFMTIFSFLIFQNSKQHIEVRKLVEFMLTKGNKILWNIKTHLIKMLNPTKKVLFEYKPLLVKMA